MIRMLAIATVATIAFAFFPASSGHALTTNDLACQSAIGTAARSFAAARHKAILQCNNALVGGKRCNTTRRDQQIRKASDKLTRSILAACRDVHLTDLGFPGFCFDVTFGDFVVGDLIECVEETHAAVVDFVFVPVEYPASPGLFGDELRCQRAIGTAAQSFVARKLRARAKCLNAQLRRKIAASVECHAEVPPLGGGTGDSRTDGAIIAATNELRSRLLDACGGVTLEDLGFPGVCFDETGGEFDVDDLRRCIHLSHEDLADELIAIEYPPSSPRPSPSPSTFPTPSPTPGGACDFTTVRFQPSGFGSAFDLGWTGLFHNQSLVTDAALSFAVTGCENPIRPCGVCTFEGPIANAEAGSGAIDNRRCAGDTALHCAADGDCGADGPCAFFFGSPQPLSGGGIGTCVLNQIDGPVAGSVDPGSGKASIGLDLTARVALNVDFDRPCPVCGGDPFSNDGQADGVCIGGAHDGDPCDANGSSPVEAFGSTSLDCPPSPATQVAELDLQWDLTTGTAIRTLTASSPDCTALGSTGRKCFCSGGGEPTRPNTCIDDTSTPDVDESFCQGFFENGFCPTAPVDTTCAFEAFRGCLNDIDCPAPGDFCLARERSCYPDNGVIGGSVSATGFADPFFGDFAFPTFAGLFCVGPTRSQAVNAATGLPGLGRLRIPVQLQLSTEIPPFCGDGSVDAGETCDPPGSDACAGGVSCQTDCSCALPTCDGNARSLNLRTVPGGDFDEGWTGIAHDLPVLDDARLPATLLCNGDDCTIASATPVGGAFLSPLPISAGGVTTCVVTRVREPVSGDYQCDSGCGSRDVKVRADVFLQQEAAEPCPRCLGDAQANDGTKGGFCSAGATPGGACDVTGVNPTFGPTSNDCLPASQSVGELDLDLALTTGTASATASINCLSGAFPAGACQCPGQVQPNSCIPDGVCPASGFCEQGPIDGVCSAERFRQCRSGTGTEDCEDVFPGAGSCIDVPRACFPNTIVRTGQCGTSNAILASVFCMPQTRAAAINMAAGLPGPAALILPVETEGCLCAASGPQALN